MSNKGQELKFESILFRKAQRCYRAINHRLRQKMIALIHKEGKMNVTEIYRKMEIEQSVASSHLGILRMEGYLKTETKGRFVYYLVNYERIKEVEEISGRLVGLGEAIE